jgi:hypothetical protein
MVYVSFMYSTHLCWVCAVLGAHPQYITLVSTKWLPDRTHGLLGRLGRGREREREQ